MPVLERLDADALRALMVGYRTALRSHEDRLNRLNVYPVPDGDTGKNMCHTLESVVSALDDADHDLGSVCQAISHASLMGASGNSGVILSQILRGITAVIREHGDVDGEVLARALKEASTTAYSAVANPVEGTILTVLRESAEAVGDQRGPLVEVLERAHAAGTEALADTPRLLPKLAQAGVVDAGGAGYLLLLDAALTLVDGRPLPEPPSTGPLGRAAIDVDAAGEGDDDDGAHGDVSELRYEVMYFLEAPDEVVPHFREVWSTIGDSIVVVGGDGIWNCHIHTDDIGAAVEAGIEAGRPRQIRVTDLLEQVEEERWVREASAEPEPLPPLEPCATGVVVVCNGAGQQRLFRSLKVQSIVVGGQTMNPSTKALLEAVEAIPAPEVIVLPNNKNIIAVAEQLDALTDKRVKVLPTTSVPQGLTALLEYDPEETADVNFEVMTELAGSVIAGEVTQAVRDSVTPVGEVREGDWIGLTGDGVCAISDSVSGAVIALLESVLTPEHGLVTLIEGDGASAADTRAVTEWMSEHRPLVAVELQQGGQPHYPYLLGIE